MNSELPFMEIKFKMPHPRKNYIKREKIFSQLSRLNEYKVAIVKAGAGCGKTTLLSGFITQSDFKNIVWLTVDASLNEPFIFWNYFIKSLNNFYKDTALDFQEFFDGNMQKDNFSTIIEILISKISINKDIFLILDDFHNISDSYIISTFNHFVENMPDNLHMVLLTREMPEIYLGTLAVQNKILLVEEDEVKFTNEESKKFLTETLNYEGNSDNLNVMINEAEGWVGGLQLLAMASKNNPQAKGMRLSDRILEDYITKEIFSFLLEEEQEFLVCTSILRYFNKEICSEYLPDCDFDYVINSIMRKNLFVINIDDNKGVYRYHAILSEFLNKIFNKYSDEKRIRLLELAADIYFKFNDFEEALYHLFEAKSYIKIMETLLKMPSTAIRNTYLMKVPLEMIQYNADFAYQYFFCYYASADEKKCEEIYNSISDKMNNNATFSAFKNVNIFYNSKWEYQKINILSLEQIKEYPLNMVTKALLLIKEAYFLFAFSKFTESLEYLEYVNEIYIKTGNIYIGFFMFSEKAQILEEIGELNNALSVYKRMEPMLNDLKSVAASYYIGIAGLYTKMLDAKKANESLEKAKEYMTDDFKGFEKAYYYTLAEYSYIVGDYEKTEKIIKDISGQDEFRNVYYSARLLRYPFYRGSHKELYEQFIEDYNVADEKIKHTEINLLYSIIMFEKGYIEKAIKLIDDIISKARQSQNKLKIVEGDLIKSRMILNSTNNMRIVKDLFVEAVTYAAENKIKLPFWFEKETCQKIWSSMESELKGIFSEKEYSFLVDLLSINHNSISVIKSEEELTEREKEVLAELANGSSNKQIAESLCISLATVKSHIINIYGKLGVNNRVAAVNKMKFKSK